jgi:hypothetical protein
VNSDGAEHRYAANARVTAARNRLQPAGPSTAVTPGIGLRLFLRIWNTLSNGTEGAKGRKGSALMSGRRGSHKIGRLPSARCPIPYGPGTNDDLPFGDCGGDKAPLVRNQLTFASSSNDLNPLRREKLLDLSSCRCYRRISGIGRDSEK